MRVIVTYGRNPKTLAVVRSLGKAGHTVHVSDDLNGPISSYSKYCSGFLKIVSPSENPTRFISTLADYARQNRIQLMIPMDDPECDLLTEQAHHLPSDLKVAMPDREAYSTARDKWKTVLLAREMGIPVPHSELIGSFEQVPELRKHLGTPFIVKPRMGSGSRGVILVREESDANSIQQTIDRFGAMIAQEFIPRRESIGVSCLAHHGELRALFTHRRLLEFPESGGPSIIRESFRHAIAEKYAVQLMERLKWHGVAMVEFRIDDRTGDPVLMEVNPRFWGSLPLAIQCGVDFPALLCAMYERGDVPHTSDYPVGKVCIRLIPNGIASIASKGGLSRMASIARHSLECRCFDVESVTDPWPMVGGIISLMEMSTNRVSYSKFYERGN